MANSLLTLGDRIRRTPQPLRAVQVVVVLTLVGKAFGKTWWGAVATALIFLLIGLAAGGLAVLWQGSRSRGN